MKSRCSNTTLMARSKMELIGIIRCYESTIDGLEEGIKKQAVGNSDKYRWHNLRKHPEDLPTEKIPFVYIFEIKETGRIGINATSAAIGEYLVECEEYKYIAWKYLEPFEEEE